jgi:hypothetical protein
MDTSTSLERKKREIHSLKTKTGEIEAPRPQGKTQKPPETGPSGKEKGGQRKSVPRVWWSWRDLNPRPQVFFVQFYMCSRLI